MFDTEPIRYLQSFSHDWLTVLMLLVTTLGSSPVQTVLISVVMFGIGFRKGLILAHMILWAALLTDLFKNLLEWPRPYEKEREDYQDSTSRSCSYLQGASPLMGAP